MNGVGATMTYFHHVVIDLVTYFTTSRLPDVNPPWEWVLITTNAVDTNGSACLSNHEGPEDYKVWSPIRLPSFANVAKLMRLCAERADLGAI
jgi:hypothetical protein